VTGGDVARTGLVVLLFLLVQQTIALNIVVAGAHPDVLLLLPIVTGLGAGPARGAAMGFAAGIVADLFVPAPFGLSALVGTLVGFAVGSLVNYSSRSPWWVVPGVALTASAAAVMLYAVLGAVLGEEQFLRADLAAIVLVVGVANALLSLPALRLVIWSFGVNRERGTLAAAGRR